MPTAAGSSFAAVSPAGIRDAVLEALGEVAPEADLGSLDESADLREQLDIDPFDMFNVVIALHERTASRSPSAPTPSSPRSRAASRT
jgi:acyl carrier protein